MTEEKITTYLKVIIKTVVLWPAAVAQFIDHLTTDLKSRGSNLGPVRYWEQMTQEKTTEYLKVVSKTVVL